MSTCCQRRIVAELDALQPEVDALKHLQAETAADPLSSDFGETSRPTGYSFAAQADHIGDTAKLSALHARKELADALTTASLEMEAKD